MSLRPTRQLTRHYRGCLACRFVHTDSRSDKVGSATAINNQSRDASSHVVYFSCIFGVLFVQAAPAAVADTSAAAEAVKAAEKAAEDQVKAKDNFARMVQLAKPEKHLIGGGVLLLAGTTSISIAVPKIMGDLVDFVMNDSVAAYTPYHAAGILMGLFASQSVMLTGRT
jgi:hypothetical protein